MRTFIGLRTGAGGSAGFESGWAATGAVLSTTGCVEGADDGEAAMLTPVGTWLEQTPPMMRLDLRILLFKLLCDENAFMLFNRAYSIYCLFFGAD